MLNGASLNARRFNIGVRPEPKLFAGDAVGEYAIEMDFARARHFEADAPVVGIVDMDGLRRRLGGGTSVVTLNAESTASDFNFVGMDDEDEVFVRPAMQREFARPAMIREWRRA